MQGAILGQGTRGAHPDMLHRGAGFVVHKSRKIGWPYLDGAFLFPIGADMFWHMVDELRFEFGFAGQFFRRWHIGHLGLLMFKTSFRLLIRG